MDQIELHKLIDLIVSKPPSDSLKEELTALLQINADARVYFFENVDDRWLDWLWRNNFLDVLKAGVENSIRYRYKTPELFYLSRISQTSPAPVVDTMLQVEISKENFNPEVVDQFLRIASELPATEIARLVLKIKEENWVELMSAFNDWGFEYKKMFEALSDAGDHESLLTLAEAVLSIKDQKAYKENSGDYFGGNPFYFKDLSYSSVFACLTEVAHDNVEKALSIACSALSAIVQLGDRAGEDSYFEYKDGFYLYDTDFFKLDLVKETNNSDRENVKSLAASIKKLVQRVFENRNKETSSNIFEKYIEALPSSPAMWRLKLYVLSLHPESLKEVAKKYFSALFDSIKSNKGYYEIASGAEYKKSLKKCFRIFDSEYQRDYVANVFKCFSSKRDDEREEGLYQRTGWEILSSICDSLNKKEQEECEKVFGKKCNAEYEPQPLIGKMRGGMISPRGLISQEEFDAIDVVDIVEKLKDEWTPERLKESNHFDNFTNPVNAEGVGSQIQSSIKNRLTDFAPHASLFFERGILDEHYTQSFYRGIWEAIRANKEEARRVDWGSLVNAIFDIVRSGAEKPFDFSKRERERFGGWLASWEGVHSIIADVLQELLSEVDGEPLVNFAEDRNEIFKILSYLLQNSDPKPEDEELETAVSKTRLPGGKDEYLVSDPFSIAINSVRGRAYQALALFVYQDGKGFLKDAAVKIADDVKGVYERLLKGENTRAIMFLFGHYLPSFYFRDKEWIRSLLPSIFTTNTERLYLYIAAWEGYLANNLYEEIFFETEFQKLYMRGLGVAGSQDPNRKYFKEPDEGLAVHLALAFMVYHQKFGFDDELFKKFWQQDVEQQVKFVNFIGRMFVSGDNKQANKLLENEPLVKQRLIEFWDWAIANKEEKKLFSGFGYWMSLDKNIFEPKWLAERIAQTLEKTSGALDWEYGLSKTIIKLAEEAPEETLAIIRLYLLEGGVRNKQLKMPFMRSDEWFEAIGILYKKAETKDGTYRLINDLIAEGGNLFWKLKEVL